MLNKFKKKLLLLGLTAAVGCSTFGLTMAYMTDTEYECYHSRRCNYRPYRNKMEP